MTFIVPFQEEFCQKEHTVYYVNEDDQHAHGSSLTTYAKCPHCKEGHIYKFYDEPIGYRQSKGVGIETYECKCASCRRPFRHESEFELDE